MTRDETGHNAARPDADRLPVATERRRRARVYTHSILLCIILGDFIQNRKNKNKKDNGRPPAKSREREEYKI